MTDPGRGPRQRPPSTVEGLDNRIGLDQLGALHSPESPHARRQLWIAPNAPDRPRVKGCSPCARPPFWPYPASPALSSAARAADADLVRNGGFEAGLDGLTCPASTSSTHRYAAEVRRCGRPRPAATTRSAPDGDRQPRLPVHARGYVRGPVRLPRRERHRHHRRLHLDQSAPDWQQLTTTFRTGPSTTKVTLYTHRLVRHRRVLRRRRLPRGPRRRPGQPPAAPAGLAVGTVTSSTVALSWSPVTGAERGLRRLPRRGESTDGHRHLDHRQRPRALHGVRLPGRR